MTARALLTIFDSLYLFSLTAWVGAILFFSFAVAPILFRVLDVESAARLVRALFPRYYAWGVVSAAIALPALVCGPLSYPELRGPGVGVQAILILVDLGIMLYCGNSLTPAINAARDSGPEQSARFDRLHGRSVRLNVVALGIGLALLLTFAARPSVRTDGLVEMTPQGRADYDREFSRALDEIVRGRTAGDDRSGSRFDEAARQELEEIVEARRRKGGAGRP